MGRVCPISLLLLSVGSVSCGELKQGLNRRRASEGGYIRATSCFIFLFFYFCLLGLGVYFCVVKDLLTRMDCPCTCNQGCSYRVMGRKRQSRLLTRLGSRFNCYYSFITVTDRAPLQDCLLTLLAS